ncbi:MAG: T9SS type A sorting domain-containing protein [Ignavibacteriaceae bacterium]|nr:T9SS type A sorting domain-containing protein [Ignavibacteriaceae bacterium]
MDEFPAVNARYVQVNFINNNQSNWAGLWEGEIWGIELITSVNDDLPSEFLLYQNYPNPFNPSTKISWQSPVGSEQTLKIYDILGNEVSTLVNEFMEAGNYEIEFNASTLPSGVYFYQLRAGDYLQTRKMLLLK